MNITTKTELNYANVLAFVGTEAASATAANFRMIAAGASAYLWGYVWAPDGAKVPANDIKANILAAFGEAKASKSKRFEFAGLCLTVARALGKGHDWGNELRQCDSVESAIDFLAARFGSVAANVSQLAAHFGTARSGGQKKGKGLPETIDAWLDKHGDDSVPFAECVAVMLPLVSAEQMAVAIASMLPKLSNDGLAALIDNANARLEQRNRVADATAKAHADAESAAHAAAQVSGEIEAIAA